MLFIILENSRLEFKNSHEKVRDFLESRLMKYDVAFCRSQDEVATKIRLSKGKYIVVSNACNPILDLEGIDEALRFMTRNNFSAIRGVGLIPGTQFDYILSPRGAEEFSDVQLDNVKLYKFNNQEIHNNQFNLYKYKRLKIFLALFKMNPQISKMSIGEFLNYLERDDVYSRIVTYFEDIDLVEYKSCPSCGGERNGLRNKMSQPLMGYIPNSKSFYFECRTCSLVFLSPCPSPEEIHRIYDEFDKEDFAVSTNNPFYDGNPRCDYSFISNYLPEKMKICDIGGGMGNYSLYMKNQYPDCEVTHCDFEFKNSDILKEAGIENRALNFLKDSIGNAKYNIITMWEVVEHVNFEKLNFVFSNIHTALEKNGLFLFSTPDFDSPLCKAYDFYSVCPPFHPLCFSKSWLHNYFSNNNDWEIVGVKSCSDFLEDAEMWMNYAIETSPGAPLRGVSKILKELLSNQKGSTNVRSLLDAGMGTEVIFALKKV